MFSFPFSVFTVDINATTSTLTDILTWFKDGNNVAIIDGMHLTRQSRQFIAQFCNAKMFHHLLVEFTCDEQSLNDNIRETVQFYKNLDNTVDWLRVCIEKDAHCSRQYEQCSPAMEGPLISVRSSENPMVHSVTARGVQGALQTAILGVLSSPVIKHQLFYFSRHGESDYNVLGRIGGDADLSARGRSYSERLTKVFGTPKAMTRPKMVCFVNFGFLKSEKI